MSLPPGALGIQQNQYSATNKSLKITAASPLSREHAKNTDTSAKLNQRSGKLGGDAHREMSFEERLSLQQANKSIKLNNHGNTFIIPEPRNQYPNIAPEAIPN